MEYIIYILLKAGANPKIINKAETTPLIYVQHDPRFYTNITLLRQAG